MRAERDPRYVRTVEEQDRVGHRRGRYDDEVGLGDHGYSVSPEGDVGDDVAGTALRRTVVPVTVERNRSLVDKLVSIRRRLPYVHVVLVGTGSDRHVVHLGRVAGLLALCLPFLRRHEHGPGVYFRFELVNRVLDRVRGNGRCRSIVDRILQSSYAGIGRGRDRYSHLVVGILRELSRAEFDTLYCGIGGSALCGRGEARRTVSGIREVARGIQPCEVAVRRAGHLVGLAGHVGDVAGIDDVLGIPVTDGSGRKRISSVQRMFYRARIVLRVATDAPEAFRVGKVALVVVERDVERVVGRVGLLDQDFRLDIRIPGLRYHGGELVGRAGGKRGAVTVDADTDGFGRRAGIVRESVDIDGIVARGIDFGLEYRVLSDRYVAVAHLVEAGKTHVFLEGRVGDDIRRTGGIGLRELLRGTVVRDVHDEIVNALTGIDQVLVGVETYEVAGDRGRRFRNLVCYGVGDRGYGSGLVRTGVVRTVELENVLLARIGRVDVVGTGIVVGNAGGSRAVHRGAAVGSDRHRKGHVLAGVGRDRRTVDTDRLDYIDLRAGLYAGKLGMFRGRIGRRRIVEHLLVGVGVHEGLVFLRHEAVDGCRGVRYFHGSIGRRVSGKACLRNRGGTELNLELAVSGRRDSDVHRPVGIGYERRAVDLYGLYDIDLGVVLYAGKLVLLRRRVVVVGMDV